MTNVTLNFEEAFANVPIGSTVADHMAAMNQYVMNLKGFQKREDSFRNVSLWKGGNRFSAAYVFSDELGNVLVFDRKNGPTSMEVPERYDAHGAVGPNFHSHITKLVTPEQRNLYNNVSVLSFNKVPGYAIESNGSNIVIMDVFNIVVPNGTLETCVDERHALLQVSQLADLSVTSKLRLFINSLK